jgi:hypothetical protein
MISAISDELSEIIDQSFPNAEIGEIYRLVFATFLRAGFGIQESEKVLLLKTSIPDLTTIYERILFDPFFEGVRVARKLLGALEVKVEYSDLEFVIKQLKKKIDGVDSVYVIDCFSPIEVITILTGLKKKKLNATIPNIYFVNIGGVTSYLTKQLGEFGTIKKFSELLSERFNATYNDKLSYFDRLVHASSFIHVRDFIQAVPIEKIFEKVLQLTTKYGSILLTSDHGYNVIERSNVLYVTHPSEEGTLKFSKYALYLISWR